MTIINCKNCNKVLLPGEKEMAEKMGVAECAECRYHKANGTRTIPEYNKWLARVQS